MLESGTSIERRQHDVTSLPALALGLCLRSHILCVLCENLLTASIRLDKDFVKAPCRSVVFLILAGRWAVTTPELENAGVGPAAPSRKKEPSSSRCRDDQSWITSKVVATVRLTAPEDTV